MPGTQEYLIQLRDQLSAIGGFWQAVRERRKADAAFRAARPLNRSREMARRLRQQPWLARAE
jgi:hypothetical protein